MRQNRDGDNTAVTAASHLPHRSRIHIADEPATASLDLPPGQRATTAFPIVSTETPPEISPDEWTFTLVTETGFERQWDWAALHTLPTECFVVDLHSEHGWTKLETRWEGVSLRVLFSGVRTAAQYAHVYTYSEYTTNLPLEDLLEMPTWIALCYEHQPIPVEHGGPARLLVPHLYLYKSAKWVRGITLSDSDVPGTRERTGWDNYGDPWREQRHSTTPSAVDTIHITP